MSAKVQADPAADNGQPTTRTAPQAAAVIRRVLVAEEDPRALLLHRHVPAFVISGAIHLALIGAMVLLFSGTEQVRADSAAQVIDTVVEEPEEPEENLVNPDVGFDADLLAATAADREEPENVEMPVVPDEPIGAPDQDLELPSQTIAPPGVPADILNAGVKLGEGDLMGGDGGLGGSFVMPGMSGRSGATKNKLLQAGGGNSLSEAAVARGLAWLAKQQRPNGQWVFDGSSKDVIAATGMALLPFLAAGETHKTGKKYTKTVAAGLTFLVSKQKANGDFTGAGNMYSTGIAAIVLCEAYGMTRDPVLKRNAQAALNFIMAGQGKNGSWGYKAGTEGDTSIVGWQVQALKSGKLCGLIVDDRVLKRAEQFLEEVSTNSGATYGYRTKGASPRLSAVGLLCRQYMGWGPRNPSLARGVEYLKKRPPQKDNWDMYYYYYATQVIHFFGGPDWHQDWNPKMRDMLIDLQEKRKGPDEGSWEPDKHQIGSHCGRLGTTALALLTLEVYYRHLPLYKRDSGGLAEMER